MTYHVFLYHIKFSSNKYNNGENAWKYDLWTQVKNSDNKSLLEKYNHVSKEWHLIPDIRAAALIVAISYH